MHVKTLSICILFSLLLMILFVLINYPYYKITHGDNVRRILARTILLNSIAIIVGWLPAVYFWPEFSLKFLLPFTCAVAAFACVGSRFIYQEIVPENLAKSIIEIIERNAKEKQKNKQNF